MTTLTEAVDLALRQQIKPVGGIAGLSGPDANGRFHVSGWIDFAALAVAITPHVQGLNQRKRK